MFQFTQKNSPSIAFFHRPHTSAHNQSGEKEGYGSNFLQSVVIDRKRLPKAESELLYQNAKPFPGSTSMPTLLRDVGMPPFSSSFSWQCHPADVENSNRGNVCPMPLIPGMKSGKFIVAALQILMASDHRPEQGGSVPHAKEIVAPLRDHPSTRPVQSIFADENIFWRMEGSM